jgi:phosphatidylserine/phosphatidylglycerophosphate/cardiolipin synthase-like enzyme
MVWTHCPVVGWAFACLTLALAGCSTDARLLGLPEGAELPLPDGIAVAFNHSAQHRYRSPITGRVRQGQDLEAFVISALEEAEVEILLAVQELSLPRIASLLVAKHRQGVRVRVVLENTYSTPWTQELRQTLPPHQRHRHDQLQALGWGDAVAMLQEAGVPLIDDTADGSRGSGLMHHKFAVVDRKVVITGSANFTPSGIHGDPDDSRSRGNVNHLLRFSSGELAAVFVEEFERLWGDGPGGELDSRFGIAKQSGGPRTVQVGGTSVTVLFAPHRRSDANHGLELLRQQLQQARRQVDMALFVFSDQALANTLAVLQQQGVRLRLLADPGFANRSFSEVTDLLGVALPDRHCKLEAGNAPWKAPLEGVGTPKLAAGDKLHHKLAVIDGRTVISGSFNWSPSAAHQNDETLLLIRSPLLARHFNREIDRLWRGAELGISDRLQRKLNRLHSSCAGRLEQRPALRSTVPAKGGLLGEDS